MTRDEAIELLGCNLSELADSLGITTAAVARWNKEQIPSEVLFLGKLLYEGLEDHSSRV